MGNYIVETVFDDFYFTFDNEESAKICADGLNSFFDYYHENFGNGTFPSLPVAKVRYPDKGEIDTSEGDPPDLV